MTSTTKREPLLLLHGLGGSRVVWEPVVGLLEAEREVTVLDMPGFGAAPPLPDGVEPSAANLAGAVHAHCEELGLERPHVAGNSLGAWVALEMGREGWAASVTCLSPAGLWKAPLGPRSRDPQRWARRLRPLVSLALRLRGPREAMLRTFAGHPERIPVEQGIAAFTALQRKGIESKFLYFPNENHWVLKPRNSVQWHDTVNGWLEQHSGQ